MSTFVLVHSPRTGPLIWSEVADALRKRRHRVVVPDLHVADRVAPPYWQRHVEAVLSSFVGVPAESPLILIGHGDGGVLLPLIAAASDQPLGAVIFVDAALPSDGLSRLELGTAPADVAALRAGVIQGGLPPWDETVLRDALPDPTLRARFLAELQPVPLAVYEEPIPEPPDWDDAPCGYLRFSSPYKAAAAEARAAGWEYAELPGGHFSPLTDPGAVTLTLVLLCARLGVDLSRR
jgi:pimeloyl-ACP methyl ester carboxylesterase